MKKLTLLVLIVSLVLVSSIVTADESSWYYSFDEITKLYQVHYNRESRLENCIVERDGDYYLAKSNSGRIIKVPVYFIDCILNHLESALEKGWVNFIFWPDLNHGHLSIVDSYWRAKYAGKEAHIEEDLERMMIEDPDKLAILYHAAEHFSHADPACKEGIRTRNVLGWFDGRPIELTGPRKDARPAHIEANTADDPEGYKRREFISITAGKNGYFAIYPDGKEIRLDISFSAKGVYDSTNYPRKQPTKKGWRDCIM